MGSAISYGWAVDGGAPSGTLDLELCLGAQDSHADAVTGYNQYGILPAEVHEHGGAKRN
ncbi:MAG: hypothetical protein AVDCRST_MAG18-247 [uncultured Thermomicrobiales bacterium]|uniref:Uncharacterized protein n=1 Tax=uncultured Thermomicrobiales bacterium TaxID=1645740 RepID=A0A6J4UI38_9BACT|nr:MAG: hypothetical protein AVDCRST_MAG18-247 [uncultured Thermomicrobiales bacterium]